MRPSWMRGVAVTLAMAALPLSLPAKKRDQGKNAPPAPDASFALEALGLHGTPTLGLLRSQAAIATLDFIDDQHILLTYQARPLISRESDDGVPVPESSVRLRQDRVIHAEVVELEHGAATESREWRVYDREPYLLAMGGARFLLRQGGRLSVVDAGLHAHRLIESHEAIVYAQSDVGSGLLLVEKEFEQHTPEEHAKMAHDALLSNAPEPVEQADVYGWRIPDGGWRIPDGSSKNSDGGLKASAAELLAAPLFHARIPRAAPLTGNSTGLVEFSGKGGASFEMFFVPYEAGSAKKFVQKFKSDCRPGSAMLRSDVVLITSCHGETANFTAMQLDGTVLWKRAAGTGALADYAHSDDGRCFAVQSVGAAATAPSFDANEQAFTQGMVQVFDVETGARVFATSLDPLCAAYHTVALSPDGMKLALLRKGALEIYSLPPVAAAQPASAAAMPATPGKK